MHICLVFVFFLMLTCVSVLTNMFLLQVLVLVQELLVGCQSVSVVVAILETERKLISLGPVCNFCFDLKMSWLIEILLHNSSARFHLYSILL